MIPLRDDNPGRTTPWATWTLVLACVAVFLGELAGLDPVPWALVPSEAWTFGALSTWPTHMFLHAGAGHLIGNMLFLLIFGNNVEDRMGHWRFLAFYGVSGVLAALAHIVLESSSEIPMVGASGAISGVLGAYLAMFPNVRVRALIAGWIPATLPAWAMLLGWFAWQFLAVPMTRIDSPADAGGGVAYAAHVGGFLAGLVLHRAFLAPAGWVRPRGGTSR